MELAEVLFQFSIQTKEYGELFFMVYPETEKKEALEKIKESANDDDSFFEKTFEALFNRATNNTHKIDDIDKTKLSREELNDFSRQFFFREFCEYEYNSELSWSENIKQGDIHLQKTFEEEAKQLSESMHMKFASLLSLGKDSLSPIKELNNSLNDILEKKESTVSFAPIKMPTLTIPKNYMLEHVRNIDSNLLNYENTLLF